MEVRYSVDNGDGWRLDVKRYRATANGTFGARPPLVFVPGYCMNTFILGFHPTGRSMVGYLTDRGYDVWTANLRGQGDAVREDPRARQVSVTDWCEIDVPQVLRFVRDTTGAPEPVLIGCSLGGSIVYGYLARRSTDHQLRAAVTLGAPLRWPPTPFWSAPILRWAELFGRVRLKGTRRLARTLLPVARRLPRLLSIYMNTRHIDLSRADVLTQTVDDPEPGINADLIRWLRDRDLIIAGTNVTEHLHKAELPILAIFANGDGIVPPSVARSITEHVPRSRVTTLEVGDADVPFAHADMFINRRSEQRVFEPLADWLDGV